MNERLSVMTFDEGEVGVTLGALYRYFYVPVDITIVEVIASPSVDDADLTIDINDDGTGAITAVSCADKDVPGRWQSTHFGGTNAPVTIAADSLCSLDANDAAANTRIMVQIWYLTGEAST
jgi:hypothetical protein